MSLRLQMLFPAKWKRGEKIKKSFALTETHYYNLPQERLENVVSWIASQTLKVLVQGRRREQSALLTNTIIFMLVSVCMVYLSFGKGFVI